MTILYLMVVPKLRLIVVWGLLIVVETRPLRLVVLWWCLQKWLLILMLWCEILWVELSGLTELTKRLLESEVSGLVH